MRVDLKKKMINGYEVGKLLANLHKISKELDKPFDAPEVLLAYSEQNNGVNEELSIYVIHPIYFPTEDCSYDKNELIIYPNNPVSPL